ncbi:hypothetical protein BC827DRAFT_1244281 [Russula dissimulans]|nr:hypothetical protein BC827DRAFT_1244281 [Russula dissimulans]
MDLRLDKTITNAALRLYRLPSANQLFRRLGDGWHNPKQEDLTLPTPERAEAKTTLRLLAAKVPAEGPRIIPYPALPEGAPSWGGRVEIIPKKGNEDYQQITGVLINDCREGNTLNVFCEGLVSNRNREDAKQLGAAAAVLYHEGKEAGHREQIFGETVTETDSRIRALNPGIRILTDFLTSHDTQQPNKALLILQSNTAIERALDPSPHEEQAAAIDHIIKIGTARSWVSRG